jgi:hypothetical protein
MPCRSGSRRGGAVHYLDANIAAIRSAPLPDIALANHLVMGPVILARGLQGERRMRSRFTGARSNTLFGRIASAFCPTHSREFVARRACWWLASYGRKLVEVLCDEVLAARAHAARTAGVDVKSFRPRRKEEAVIGLRQLADKLAAVRQPIGEVRLALRRRSASSIRAVIVS